MSIWDTFSKRKKRAERQGQEDVYQYHELPLPFRVQVIHIWVDALGRWQEHDFGPPISGPPNAWWIDICTTVMREKGVFALTRPGDNPFVQCQHYVQAAPTDEALDIIEVSFFYIDQVVRRMDPYEIGHLQLTAPDDAIAELNGRFREHGIGYQYAGGEIVRVDSEYIHAEAVKPALQLLHGAGKGFTGPLDEFMAAHKHYREGNHKDAILNAGKAFESVLKAICTARRWTFDPHKDTANKLIEIVFSNGLVPTYLQGQFTSLKAVVESGVPTVRNKTSGHGQGATPTAVPKHLVAYVLHLTASNIVFLIQAHQNTR